MPFGQTYDNTVATNVEEKKEKDQLQKELAKLNTEIEEKQKLSEQVLGASEVLPDKTKELEEVRQQILECQKTLAGINDEIRLADQKHTQAVMAVIDKTATSHELDAEVAAKKQELENLAGKILQVEQKAKENDEKSLILAQNIADFEGKKQVLEAEIQGLEDGKKTQLERIEIVCGVIQAKTDEHKTILGAIEKQNVVLSELEDRIIAKKEKSNTILVKAKEQAQEIIEQAKQEVQKLHLALNEREGEITRREGWNKEKEEYLQNLKTELEKHLGKTIKMYFGESKK